MSGRPNSALTLGILGSLIRLVPTCQEPELRQRPGKLLMASVHCLPAFVVGRPALLLSLSLPFFCSISFSDQLPWTSFKCHVRVFETWPFNSQKSLGKLLGFRLCRGHIALNFSFQLMFKKTPHNLKRDSSCTFWISPGVLAEASKKRRQADWNHIAVFQMDLLFMLYDIS